MNFPLPSSTLRNRQDNLGGASRSASFLSQSGVSFPLDCRAGAVGAAASPQHIPAFSSGVGGSIEARINDRASLQASAAAAFIQSGRADDGLAGGNCQPVHIVMVGIGGGIAVPFKFFSFLHGHDL